MPHDVLPLRAAAARLGAAWVGHRREPLAVQHEQALAVAVVRDSRWGTSRPGRTLPPRSPPALRYRRLATVLLSALATSSVSPSADTARLFGVVPTGALGYSATGNLLPCGRVARSITQTAFVFAHATNRRRPSLENANAFGCSPTGNSPAGSRVTASNARTRAPPQIGHEERLAVRRQHARVGLGRQGDDTLHAAAVSTSTTTSARPKICTANSRDLPSGADREPADEARVLDLARIRLDRCGRPSTDRPRRLSLPLHPTLSSPMVLSFAPDE